MTTQFICSKMFTDLNIKYPYNCIKNCCKSNDLISPLDDLDLVYNEEYMRRKKSMVLDNELPQGGCDTCIYTEPNSLFRTWNEWDTIITDKEPLLDYNEFTIYEFVLSSACDLKCVYCAPKDSTSWAKEMGVPINRGSDEWKEKTNEKLWAHLGERSYNDKVYFFFSGGEVTYNNEGLLFIKKILDIVPPQFCNIVISTNGNTKAGLFKRYLDLIQETPEINWVFDISLDSTHERCEAIRYGLKWDRAIENITSLSLYKNVMIRLSLTVNLMSVPTLKEDLKWYYDFFKSLDRPLLINNNMVQEDGLSPMSLHPDFKEKVQDAIDFIRPINTEYADHLINIKELVGSKYSKWNTEKVAESILYFMDMRPETDWLGLFPHIREMIYDFEL